MRTTTRKGFPLPDPTDVYNVTYPVGPPGRTFNITGIVRDTDNAQGTIADNMTEYNQDEIITGRWEFQNGIVADKGSVALFKNNTGSARVAGDVVITDPSADMAFIQPNVSGIDGSRVMVVAENIATGAIGRVTLSGTAIVKVAGGTLRGQYLQTVAGQYYASGSAIVVPGSFAYSLTAPDASNTVTASIRTGGIGGGGLEVKEVDGTPDVVGTRALQFPNGSLTDLGGQVVGVTFPFTVREVDLAPTVNGVNTIQVPNGALIDRGSGVAEIVFPPTLEVKEVDGAPDVVGAKVLTFPNGSLTDQGSGSVAITFGSGIVRRDQFLGVSGTTVTLSMPADTIMSVSKNGLEERSGTDYTVAGTIVTFTTALVSDDISVVYYQVNSFVPGAAPYYQEFDPPAAATTVTLMSVPGMILGVVRNGVTQSTSLGDWTWNSGTTTVTFSDAFVAGEHVIVTWSQNFGSGNASTVNNIPAVPASTPQANALVAVDGTAHLPLAIMPTSTVFHEEFVPANAATTVTLSQTPQTLASVFRDGVLQSAQDGHYTISGNVITFADAFDGLTRVVINYLYGVVLGDANTVKGFNASSDTVATPGTIVATNPTTGKLPGSVIPSTSPNLLTNGSIDNWQRGNGPFTAYGTFAGDRWNNYYNGSGTPDVLSISRDNANSDGSLGSCAACTYTANVGGSYYVQVLKTGDGYFFAGRTISFSIRVKTSSANAIRATIFDATNATINLSPYHIGNGQYQTLTVTATIVPSCISVWVGVYFTSSCTAYVDNAMLVQAATPADYIPTHPADELARCLRYYQKVGGENGSSQLALGQCSAATQCFFQTHYQVPPALTPTVTYGAVGVYQVMNATFSPLALTSITTDFTTTQVCRTVIGVSNGLVAGNVATLFANNSTAGSIAFEANP